MATKSILKDIKISDMRLVGGLTTALSNAKNKMSKDVKLSRKLEEVKGEAIKSFFGVK